jgi:hypothetical protein
MRSPIEAVAGEVVTAPSLTHGPSAFDATYRPKARTQFAPHGTIAVPEPEVLDLYRGPCVCTGAGCIARPTPYSMQALLLEAPYGLAVRGLLQKAGVVVASPALAAAGPTTLCTCRAIGGPDMFSQYAQFVVDFADTSIAQVMEPAQQAAHIVRVYVDKVLGDIRAAVLAQARMNYVRAEGPRAWMEPRPEWAAGDDPLEGDAPLYPRVLPGTGIEMCEEDTAFAARALTDPRANARNRAYLRCAAGLSSSSSSSSSSPGPGSGVFDSRQTGRVPGWG